MNRFAVLLLLLAGCGKGKPAAQKPVSPITKSLNVVKDCGAKADGKTDDTAAIQKCMNEAKP
jgi:polygalacturonase